MYLRIKKGYLDEVRKIFAKANMNRAAGISKEWEEEMLEGVTIRKIVNSKIGAMCVEFEESYGWEHFKIWLTLIAPYVENIWITIYGEEEYTIKEGKLYHLEVIYRYGDLVRIKGKGNDLLEIESISVKGITGERYF